MVERVSLGMAYGNARKNVAINYDRLYRAQVQLTTGRRIPRGSDDPVGTRRVMALVRQQVGVDRNMDAIQTARSHLESGAGQLTQVTDMVARVRELSVQGANGTLDVSDRLALALEIDQIVRDMVATGNTQLQGRYLFGGTRTNVSPFQLVMGSDGLQAVRYVGNDEMQEVEVAPGVRTPLNVPGSRVFGHGSRQGTTFRGTTGAAPSPGGGDSGVGRTSLQIDHTETFFGGTTSAPGIDPVTGLAPGASSAARDTVLGKGHTFAVTTDASGNGTISLNGGTAIPFSSTDTDLQVLGPLGEVVYVDTSGMSPNLTNVSVALDGRGTLSTDGGLTTIPIDFTSTSLSVVNSETGASLRVDATGIRLAGREQVTFEGTVDLFTATLALADALRDPNLTSAQVSELVNARLSDLDDGLTTLTTSLAVLGSRSAHLDTTENRLAELDVTLSELRSRIEDTDISQTIIDIKQYENLYQSSLLLASRINDLSLLNFI